MIELSAVIGAIEVSGVVPDMSKFDPNKRFKDNGMDSLDVMNMLLTVEEQLGIKITEEEASQINSAASIVDIINGRR